MIFWILLAIFIGMTFRYWDKEEKKEKLEAEARKNEFEISKGKYYSKIDELRDYIKSKSRYHLTICGDFPKFDKLTNLINPEEFINVSNGIDDFYKFCEELNAASQEWNDKNKNSTYVYYDNKENILSLQGKMESAIKKSYYMKTSSIRSTHCGKCHRGLSSISDYTCSICGGLICNNCGACFCMYSTVVNFPIDEKEIQQNFYITSSVYIKVEYAYRQFKKVQKNDMVFPGCILYHHVYGYGIVEEIDDILIHMNFFKMRRFVGGISFSNLYHIISNPAIREIVGEKEHLKIDQSKGYDKMKSENGKLHGENIRNLEEIVTGTKIIHVKYGEGVVHELNDDILVIKFCLTGEAKKFQASTCIDNKYISKVVLQDSM